MISNPTYDIQNPSYSGCAHRAKAAELHDSASAYTCRCVSTAPADFSPAVNLQPIR